MGADSLLGSGLLFGGLVTGVLLLIGYLTGGGTFATGTISSPPNTDTSCSGLCTAWNDARTRACTAQSALTAANSSLIAATATLNAASIVAASLLVAAIAAALIPVIGPFVSKTLLASYAVAQAAAVFLLGQQLAAANNQSTAASDLAIAMASVGTARAALMAGCGDAAALSRCLATPSPCPGVP